VRLVGASSGSPPLFAETAVLLDLMSFLAMADMALNTYADGQLRSRRIVPTRFDTPWRLYIKECDNAPAAPPRLAELRRLDLRLVEARNRLLAHRLRDHSLQVVTWRRTKRVQIAMVPAAPSVSADAKLRRVAARLGQPATGALEEVVDRILEEAGRLTKSQRNEVIDGLREVGYRSGDPSLIVRDLISVTSTIT
jgi:hypothetical protein